MLLGNRCSIKQAFCSFLDNGFNAASKLTNMGFKLDLNTANFFPYSQVLGF